MTTELTPDQIAVRQGMEIATRRPLPPPHIFVAGPVHGTVNRRTACAVCDIYEDSHEAFGNPAGGLPVTTDRDASASERDG